MLDSISPGIKIIAAPRNELQVGFLLRSPDFLR
jgi:hypothetical protein